MKLPAEQVPACSVLVHPDVLQLPWVPGDRAGDRAEASLAPATCTDPSHVLCRLRKPHNV